MNTNFFLKFEKKSYPTGKISSEGEHLRTLAINASNHVLPAGKQYTNRFLPIFIPTNRAIHKNAKQIRRIIRLISQRPNALLIFLCSPPANKDSLEAIVKEYSSLQWIIFDGPFLHSPITPALKTTQMVLANRNGNDLPQKRNFALQLARQMHWNTIFLLDDDTEITNTHLDKAYDLIQTNKVSLVGFNARDFPDHSVAMHAYKWAHNSIDSFICGGALAIKTNTSFTSFFPHIYNEDWMFMLPYRLLNTSSIMWAGTIKQHVYNPFKNPLRALSEEAGDIIAESMYKLAFVIQESRKHFETTKELAAYFRAHANEHFWNSEITNRLHYLQEVREKIAHKQLRPIRRRQALHSLDKSIAYLLDPSGITGKTLTHWVKAWCQDIEQLNHVIVPKKPQVSIPDALKALGCANTFISGGIDLMPEPVIQPLQTPSQPKEPYLYRGFTVRPRSRFIKEGLWLTQTTQNYLESRGLSLEDIAKSSTKLRFDRPLWWQNAQKPDLTICMIVSYEESVVAVRGAVQRIIKSVHSKGVCQLIVWIYNNSPHATDKQTERYRNQLIAQLVYDVASTNLYLRSGILALRQGNLHDGIDKLLDDISFASWKDFIRSDHPILIANSHNELLRFGTFCQFMHQEQRLPRFSLEHNLKTLTQNMLITHKLTPESDAIAIYTAKELLVRPQKEYHLRNWRTVTKHTMRRMKKAKLSWLEQDDLAYSLTYHTDSGTGSSLNHIKRMICIPISLQYAKTIHHEALATKITARIVSDFSSTAYLLIIQGAASDSWKEIDTYQKTLLTIIQGHLGDTTPLLSMSYRFLPGESLRLFKHRVLSTAEYIHWLQNHDDRITIKWIDNYTRPISK